MPTQGRNLFINPQPHKGLHKIKIIMYYGLWIAGTQVTSENCNDISNFDEVSGKVRYNPSSKTLTLDNATIGSIPGYYKNGYNDDCQYDYACIRTIIRDLTIIVRGNCELNWDINDNGDFGQAISIHEDTTIKGSGTLKVYGSGHDEYELGGIAISPGKRLTIKDCTVDAYAFLEDHACSNNPAGIFGGDGSKLIVKNANIIAFSGTNDDYHEESDSIAGIDELSLIDCAITEPSGAYYNSNKREIQVNGERSCQRLIIKASKPNNTLSRHEYINEGLREIEHDAYDLLNSDMYDDDYRYPEAIEDVSDRDFAYILDKRQSSFSEKEIYVRGSGYENIYPGAILFVDSDITSGSPNPLGRIPRSKISIYGDFLAGGNPSQSNIDPNNSDVRMAINNIMHTLLSDSRYDAPGAQRPRTKIHTSQKSLMMDLGVDSSFAGCNVNVRASATSSEQSFIQATTLDQDYFTIRLKDDWHQDPASLFADEVTWDDLSRELNGKAIAIVTSVTYGRTFSYMKEYSARQFTFDSSQKVSGYGQSADASQSLAESSSYTNDEIFNLGGTSLTISALRGKNTQHELEEAMADNMRFSHANQGVVTKYTIQLITGSAPGRVVRPLYSGTQYQIGYTKCPRRLFAHIDVSRVHIGPGKVKVQLDVECFRVGKYGEEKGKILPTKKVNGGSPEGAQDPWYYTFSHSQNREYGDLQPGEYINKGPLLRIRSKRGGGSYEAQTEKRLSPKEMETGALNISLSGSVYDSVKIRDLEPFNP